MNEEISDLASYRAQTKALQHINVTPLAQNLVSPKGLLANPSKMSLATDSYHVGANKSTKSPRSMVSALISSPPGTSGSATLGRELKHLNRYLDAREM